MIALQLDVVRNLTHGTSDATSGTLSHVLGQATGDSSFQEEWEQTCQTSGNHFKVELIIGG